MLGYEWLLTEEPCELVAMTVKGQLIVRATHTRSRGLLGTEPRARAAILRPVASSPPRATGSTKRRGITEGTPTPGVVVQCSIGWLALKSV